MRLFNLVIMAAVVTLLAYRSSAQTTTTAPTAAQIWGTSGFERHVGQNYQIGCMVSGQAVVVASSKMSFDDARSKVNLLINGVRVLTAVARDVMNNTATSAPVPVVLCNP